MKTAIVVLSLALAVHSNVHAADCGGDDEGLCIPQGKACNGRETECCDVPGKDMGCFGFNFFKTCQEVPTCLKEWNACQTDGHILPCCGDDMECTLSQNGMVRECQRLTPETSTRTVAIPGVDLKTVDEDPPTDENPNLAVTPKPSPMGFWQGCIKGDPHITTFDGTKYDCHGVGEFIVAKSKVTRRMVQARFRPFGNKASISVMKGIVVQDEGDTPKVQIATMMAPKAPGQISTPLGDDCKIQLFVDDAVQILEGGYTHVNAAGEKTLEITFDKGNIKVTYPKSEMWFDIQINSSCRFSTCWNIPKGDNSLIGLLGSPDGVAANDWMNKDGKGTSYDIRMADDDQYAYGYCTDHWCMESRDQSLFKYNEPDWGFDELNECANGYGVSETDTMLQTATPEIMTCCLNQPQCIFDVMMDGGDLNTCRKFFANAEEEKSKRLGENLTCLKGDTPSGNCRDHLVCYSFGGFVGDRCVKKIDLDGNQICHPKKAECTPGQCCADLVCQEVNGGMSLCIKAEEEECDAFKKKCTGEGQGSCCNSDNVCWGREESEKYCLLDKEGEKGQLCGPRGCKGGLYCVEGKCREFDDKVKKGGLCGLSDEFMAVTGNARPCADGGVCTAAENGKTRCAKVDKEQMSCKRACVKDDDCCEDDKCITVKIKDPITKQKRMAGQCRKNKVKGIKSDSNLRDENGKCVRYEVYSPTEEENPDLPPPDSCVLKRASELLKFAPNFPQSRPDVFIEVMIDNNEDKIFTFKRENFQYQGDEKEGVIDIANTDIFRELFAAQEKLGGDGFMLRYNGRNGPGGWNSCKYSPIALDLNGDKVISVIRSGPYQIDINGDGLLNTLDEWFAPEEGILINTKEEGDVTGHDLFGDEGGKYANGFDKLSTYDQDCDGKLSGDELKGLYIWIDRNSNLKLDKDEIKELKDYKIEALSTGYDDDLKSVAYLENGDTMLMQDLWFSAAQNRRR